MPRDLAITSSFSCSELTGALGPTKAGSFTKSVAYSISFLSNVRTFSYSPVALPNVLDSDGNFLEPNNRNRPSSIIIAHAVPPISISSDQGEGSTIITYIQYKR